MAFIWGRAPHKRSRYDCEGIDAGALIDPAQVRSGGRRASILQRFGNENCLGAPRSFAPGRARQVFGWRWCNAVFMSRGVQNSIARVKEKLFSHW